MRNCTLDSCYRLSRHVISPSGAHPVAVLWLSLLGLLATALPSRLAAQCNPAGNPTRYEFNLNPTSMLNLLGQQFCTSQAAGTNCCGAQPSYRCLDLVFNLQNGPLGELFGENCHGMVNLMTAQGNFDALYFNVGTPNPLGNAANCAVPISLGNNHTISVGFAGNALGQLLVTLSVANAMGVQVYSNAQTASPGQALILTVCKPGFGCLEDEIIFGCCSASATLALAPGAPGALCAGGSSTLKVTGLGGSPPYTATLRAAGVSDTSYFTVLVPNDLDGNSSMDMVTAVVAPFETTTYTLLSVVDATGCVQPVAGQSVSLAVNPPATVFAGNDQVICQNQQANLAASLGGAAASGTWSGGSGMFSNAASPITTYLPAPGEAGTTVQLTFTSNDPPGPCPAVSDALAVTINTLPLVYAGKDMLICQDENLSLNALGASFQANGSGATGAVWSSSGSGTFQPNAVFGSATTYVLSAADKQAAFVTLSLTSTDPPGPCTPASDQLVLHVQPDDGLVCNDKMMVSLDDDGMVEISADMILEGDFIDSMFLVDVFVNGVSIGSKVGCAQIGKTLLVRVTDNCSGVYCTGSICVADNLAPKLQCTDIELICAMTDYSPDYLKNVLGLAAAYPVVQENCGAYTLKHSDTWVSLSCDDDYIGYVRRVWTAVDPTGNKSTCTQYLNFIHQYITDVKFPADITLNCSSGPVNTLPQATGAPYLTAYGLDFPIVEGTGHCKLSATYKDNTIAVCDGSYDILRTWTVYDWCTPTTPQAPFTNPLYIVQHIGVHDDTGPVLNCPGALTVGTDPLNCCATTNLPDMIVTDVCSQLKSGLARVEVHDLFTGDVIAVYEVAGVLKSFPGNNVADPDTLLSFGYTPCLPLGIHTVTYTVEDNCGNLSTCSFALTVADHTPPVAACDEVTQVSLGIDGMILVNALTFDDGSYDNCSAVGFKVRRLEANNCQPNTQFFDQVKFCCEDINDTVKVILRVYDVPVSPGPVALDWEELHANECLVQVYIEDKLKPSCQPPDHVSVSCENFDPSLWVYGAASGADNCCVDTILVQVNYNQFDTVCNRGTITRTFRVFDCGGQSNQCTQRIVVDYEQDYFIRFPHDVILTVCDGSANYGEPQFFGEDCELLGVSSSDEIFTVVPDACFKIERTWKIINWCTFDPNKPCIYVPNPNPNATLNHPSNLVGPTVSPPGTPAPWAPTVVKVNPGDAANTNFSSFWAANANCYVYKQIIKVIDTQKPEIQCPAGPEEVCDLSLNDTQLWNEAQWFDALSGSHDLCEAPTDLCITATDLCSGPNINIRYLLFLDLDHNGSMETVLSSTNLPDPNTIPFGNAGNANYGGGTPIGFDERPVPLNQKYRFAIQASVIGNTVQACLRWNTLQQPDKYTVPELPYGTHKIKWFVEDGCGNERVCEYTFVVKDCKAPSVVCHFGLTVNLMPTGMVSVNWQSFFKDVSDNCTPPNLLVYGIRSNGTGTGFPFLPDGSPQTSVLFDCLDVGFNLVELWAMDLAGNADYCTTYIQVQDNIGVCTSPDNASVAGVLQTEFGQGVEDVDVQVQSTPANGQAPQSMLSSTDPAGHFAFPNSIPLNANAVLSPLKDNDPLNGVSTFDLVLINKHILGLEPLSSAYRMIAADANNSRSITTFDIVELRKLILGVYTDLPGITSWRFIDKAYTFPNPYNPFQDVFPESIAISNLQSDKMEEDFVAVKTGDVNGNAIASSLFFVDDRSDGTVLWDLEDRLVKPGEVFSLPLQASESLLGYQFTLYFPELELLDLDAGAGQGLDNFALFPAENALTTSFHAPAGQPAPAGFTLLFRAKTGGLLSQLLQLSSRITRAEAYRLNVANSGNETHVAIEKMNVALRFNGQNGPVVVAQGFELYQNQPNPWTSSTRIGFHLPETTSATFTLLDETGRVLLRQEQVFQAGYNSIPIDDSLLRGAGVWFYQLETPTDSAVRKMVRMR